MSRKTWTFGIHPDYNYSLRHVVSDADRYPLGIAIREKLERSDDPTEGAMPVIGRPGRYTIELLDYIVTFEVPVDDLGNLLEDADKIRLLPIQKKFP